MGTQFDYGIGIFGALLITLIIGLLFAVLLFFIALPFFISRHKTSEKVKMLRDEVRELTVMQKIVELEAD